MRGSGLTRRAAETEGELQTSKAVDEPNKQLTCTLPYTLISAFLICGRRQQSEAQARAIHLRCHRAAAEQQAWAVSLPGLETALGRESSQSLHGPSSPHLLSFATCGCSHLKCRARGSGNLVHHRSLLYCSRKTTFLSTLTCVFFCHIQANRALNYPGLLKNSSGIFNY